MGISRDLNFLGALMLKILSYKSQQKSPIFSSTTWISRAYLSGLLYMEPVWENQQMWAENIGHQKIDKSMSSWEILQSLTMPLIQKWASASHLQGCELLKLNHKSLPPEFEQFQLQVQQLTGWLVVEANEEMPSKEFFLLLAQKKFPCVRKLRPQHAVLCGYEPDFWHEAVGHIAVITDPNCAQFYQWCGHKVTELYDHGFFQLAKKLENILWIVLEYGLLENHGQKKTIGAALSGSFMALQRLQRGYIVTQTFDCQKVLESKLYQAGQKLRRNWRGQIILFSAPTLKDYQIKIEEWLRSTIN